MTATFVASGQTFRVVGPDPDGDDRTIVERIDVKDDLFATQSWATWAVRLYVDGAGGSG